MRMGNGHNCILGSHRPWADPRRGWVFVSTGRGDVPGKDAVRALNSIGYTGRSRSSGRTPAWTASRVRPLGLSSSARCYGRCRPVRSTTHSPRRTSSTVEDDSGHGARSHVGGRRTVGKPVLFRRGGARGRSLMVCASAASRSHAPQLRVTQLGDQNPLVLRQEPEADLAHHQPFQGRNELGKLPVPIGLVFGRGRSRHSVNGRRCSENCRDPGPFFTRRDDANITPRI